MVIRFVMVVVLAGCVEPGAPAGVEVEPTPDAGPFVCGPTTCTGCCLGNQCLGGNLDEACGYDGRACRRCSAQSRCEAPGACFARPGSADAGVAKPTDFSRCQIELGFVLCR